MNLPEITDVERLTLRPGDTLVIRIPDRISAQQAVDIATRLRAVLKLDEGAPVMVLDCGASVEVIGAPDAEEPEITR